MEESAKEDPQLFEKLVHAIGNQNFHNVKELTKNAPRGWCRKAGFTHTALQEAIRHNSKEIFDYILPFHDALDLETVGSFDETALMFTLNMAWNFYGEIMEYYACKLIKKGAFIHTVYKNEEGGSFLHRAVNRSSMALTKLLLEKGIGVNVQDNKGCTAQLSQVYFDLRRIH